MSLRFDMKYIIGLDIGSTNAKGVLTDENYNIVAAASRKFEYDSPSVGAVEIPASRFAESCFEVIRELTAALPAGGELTGISEVSASGNLVLLDRDMKPLTPIYNWQNARVTDEVEKVLGADFDYRSYYEKIGWPLGRAFPVAELCYIKCHEPELLERAAMVTMSTEYLNFLLTGKFGISPSAGTPFFLIDQTKNAYDGEMLSALGIDESRLPPIMEIGETLGGVTDEMCERLGLPCDVQVHLGTFDHPGGAISTGVTEEGSALLSCGTSWVAFMPIKDREAIIENGFLCDPFLSGAGGPWAAMCSVACIGNTVNELVEKYISTNKDKYKKLDDYAAASNNGAGGLKIDPENTDDPKIAEYPIENIAYAIMELPAHLLREQLEAFVSRGVSFSRIYMAGGPTKSAIWVKIAERTLGLEVTVSNAEYSGAVGAAMIAKKGKAI